MAPFTETTEESTLPALPPRCPLLILLALASLLIAATATAAKPPGWTRPVELGRFRGGADMRFPLVGVARDGSSLTVWQEHWDVKARWRAANGQLGPEQRITPPADGKRITEVNNNLGTQLAVAPDGTAVILWQITAGREPHAFGLPGHQELYARIRSRSGRLSPVERVSSNSGGGDSAVFFGSSTVWAVSGEAADPADPTRGGVFLQSFTSTLGAGPRIRLNTAPVWDDDAAVAVDRRGNALIVWGEELDSGGNAGRVLARTLPRDGVLGSLLTISRPGVRASNLPLPRLVLDPSGRGYVVWGEASAPLDPARLEARQVSTTGQLGPTLTLVRQIDPQASPMPVDAAAFGDGRAIVAWANGRYGPVYGRILSANRAGRTFLISEKRYRQEHHPSVVASGNRATVLWRYCTFDRRYRFGGKCGFRSRTVGATGRRGSVATLLPLRGDAFIEHATLAGNAAGNLIAAWTELRAGVRHVRLSVFSR